MREAFTKGNMPNRFGKRGYYRGYFTLNKVGDTFLNFETWGKGQVYVNGHPLGRIWSIGPQQTLYMPGCWLKKGRNEIIVQDITGPKDAIVWGQDHPELDKLQLEKTNKHNNPGHITSNQVIGSFAQMEMKAPEGSTLDLYLPDSTNIHLNSGSLISYSQGYNISDRNVALDGEAFFKVRHNKELPFRVLTAEMVVEDIGTEFFIRNYRDENEAVAGLISGKISLRNQLDKSLPVEMSAGDKVIIDKSTGKMKLMKRAVSPSTTCDDIYFENMNLYDVAQILSRSYGVSIKVRDKIKGIGFYGYFNRKEDAVGDIIDAISRSCHIHYKKDKNSYYLY